ncbi:hypothetical protein P171DRAFT_430232 [Karstenula rhodostoma CBS 690.94]|uniref:Uncharacterized protein n=1 Tax=Karstenula rhodostoma CBS 690.94 TaxID=1392251 RepID=A0A9P4UEP6_9PLEO|nr:hypothetical protein P171DRAFT_430232 [Karstenula rhodostoma CBS 690.94]
MPHNQQYFDTMMNQNPPFTDAQRSQQARGKSYASKSAGEPYESRVKREQAAQILESLELLVWQSNARNESVAQTRQHFQNVMLGLPDAEPAFREEYERSAKAKDPHR